MSRTDKQPTNFVEGSSLFSPRWSVFRLVFKAYDHKLLANLCLQITADLQSEGYSARTVSLPTKIRKYCVLTSPHVYKKAREQLNKNSQKDN
jgi:small subunit ribosomal protein S10